MGGHFSQAGQQRAVNAGGARVRKDTAAGQVVVARTHALVRRGGVGDRTAPKLRAVVKAVIAAGDLEIFVTGVVTKIGHAGHDAVYKVHALLLVRIFRVRQV